MHDLGDRHDDDPRMGRVDVDGYGSWAAWHASSGREIPDADGGP